MDWKEVGGLVADAAPVLGTVLGGPAGGAVGALVASVFGTKSDPEEVAKAIQADPEAMVKLRQIEAEHERELRRMVIEAETGALAETNATYRAEIASDDDYVKRMRPSFGYVLMATIAAEAMIAVYVAGWEPGRIKDLAVLYEALALPQSVALAVLGVYFKGRTNEKSIGAGIPPGPGLLQNLFGKG